MDVIKKSTIKNRLNRWRSIDRSRIPRLLKQYGAVCWYCGLSIPERTQQSVDHIISLAKLARQISPPNERPIALACHICNSAKANRTVEEFSKWINHIRSSNFSSIMVPKYPSIFELVFLNITNTLTKFKFFSII